MYTDLDACQVKQIDTEANLIFEMGSGQGFSNDGCKYSGSFVQPFGVCTEGRSIYITDAANGKLKLLSPIACTLSMLASLNQIYSSFGVHLKGMEKPAVTIDTGCNNMQHVYDFVNDMFRVLK